MVRFPNAAQRARRALILAVMLRTLQTIAILLAVCFYAPLLALFGALIAHFVVGVDAHTSSAIVNGGCEFARATINYAFLCGAN